MKRNKKQPKTKTMNNIHEWKRREEKNPKWNEMKLYGRNVIVRIGDREREEERKERESQSIKV